LGDLNLVTLRHDLDDDGRSLQDMLWIRDWDPRSAFGVVSIKVGTTREARTRSEIELGCGQTSGIRTCTGTLQSIRTAMSPD
jgi:hypothetical protein